MFAPKPSGRRPELCLSEHNSAEIMYILPGKVNGLATNLSAIPCHTNCETYVKGSVTAEHGNVSELPEARASLPRVYCRRVYTGSETAPGQVVQYSSVELVYTLLKLSEGFPDCLTDFGTFGSSSNFDCAPSSFCQSLFVLVMMSL